MKKLIIILIIFILIILSITYYYYVKQPIQNNLGDDVFPTQNDNTTNDNMEDSNENQDTITENLNRVIYKDGFYYEEIGEDIKKRITGCSLPIEFDKHYKSISYEDLRYINIRHYDFEGNEQIGEVIVHKEVAEDIVKIFYELYAAEYKINKMVLIDEYNGDDELSMSDNNTSAFNYRVVQNSKTLSLHAFGLAIDINPLNNPYIKGNTISPANARSYIDRNLKLPEMIYHKDLAYKVFTEYGWKWGGDYKSLKDYQHFYRDDILNSNTLKRKSN